MPSINAEKVIDQLIKYGETKRGWLGVRIQNVTKEIAEAEKLDKPRGALVSSVAEGSPSDKGGIKAGDIILEFDGKLINEMRELPMIVAQTKVGKTVKLKVWRNKKEIYKRITLGRLETSDDFKASKPKEIESYRIENLKAEFRKLTKEDIQNRKLPPNSSGVVITKIDPDSPIVNLEVNNIIIEAQKRKVKTPGDLDNIIKISILEKNKTILIVIYNNQNQKSYIGIKLN